MPMNEPLKFYDRTIKLPCENLESGRSRQAELDARIKEEITSLTGESGHWQSESDKDDRGNLAVTLKSRTCVVSLQTRYGQNEKYIARERHSFICYEIRAENRIVTLDRAANSAENLRLITKIIGGITGPIMLFGLFYLILQLLGFVIIPYVLIFVALVGGVWGGGKLGDLLGSAMERRAERRAENQGVISEAAALWGMLTFKLDQIIEPYERM
jgi:hypothetical protein